MNRFFALLSALIVTFFSTGAFAAPTDKEIGFQEPATPTMRELVNFHDHILLPIITGIVIFVFLLLAFVLIRFNAKANPEPSKTTHNVPLEIIWTLIPVLILIVIAVPSFRLLFFAAVTPEAEMTLKATGNQWNWTYDYPDHGDINFTAVVDKEKEPKLLATDNPVVLPVDTVIRIQVTASDVIHSFAVPAFGIKTDAVPGRLNETWVKIEKPGTYYGQCSELCGKDHGYMPIEVKAVSKEEFASWVVAQGGKMPAAEPAADATPAAVPANTDQKVQSPSEPGQAPVSADTPEKTEAKKTKK